MRATTSQLLRSKLVRPPSTTSISVSLPLTGEVLCFRLQASAIRVELLNLPTQLQANTCATVVEPAQIPHRQGMQEPALHFRATILLYRQEAARGRRQTANGATQGWRMVTASGLMKTYPSVCRHDFLYVSEIQCMVQKCRHCRGDVFPSRISPMPTCHAACLTGVS